MESLCMGGRGGEQGPWTDGSETIGASVAGRIAGHRRRDEVQVVCFDLGLLGVLRGGDVGEGTALAVPTEVLDGKDLEHGGVEDAEVGEGEGTGGHDHVGEGLLDGVAGDDGREHRRHLLPEEAQDVGDGRRQRDRVGARAGLLKHVVVQLAEGVDLGPAQLEDLAGRGGLDHRLEHGRCDVAHVDGLDEVGAVVDEGLQREQLGVGCDAVEEAVLRAKHGRRPKDRGTEEGVDHGRLPFSLGLGPVGDGVLANRERRHVDEPVDAHVLRHLSDGTSSIHVYVLELPVHRLEVRANQVDDHVGTGNGLL
mmetsp:Transcript_5109/g.8789  ORF Transcript_5109/g.8789 Transcript_5109/m.8789 type:complete len:309 (-) Transcript_5109:356-1282(-)